VVTRRYVLAQSDRVTHRREAARRWAFSPLLCAAAALLSVPPVHAVTPKRELTPADAIATVRVMQNQVAPGSAIDDGTTSPDGKRYIVRLSYGDAKRNGAWVDLLTGRLDSLTTASRPTTCAHLFTTGRGSTQAINTADFDPHPSNLLRWLSDHEVALLWTDDHRVRQILSVDLDTCKSHFLTHSPTPIFSFGVAPNGTLLFDAQAPRTSAAPRLWAHGFTVSDSSDGWAILKGEIDGVDEQDLVFNSQWFIQDKNASPRPLAIGGRRIDRTNPTLRDIMVSPNSRFALVGVGVQSTPEEWNRYPDANLKSDIEINRTTPNRTPLSFALVDLQRGTSRSLWTPPNGSRCQARWSPNSASVLLAPTFLPLETNDASGLGEGGAVEVNVRTHEYSVLPVDLRSRIVTNIAWSGAANVEMSSTDLLGADSRTERFQKIADQWQTISNDGPTLAARDTAAHSPIHIEVRQSLNTPPQIVAVDAVSGDSRLVLDPNPHLLTRFKLGQVTRLSGTLPSGHPWLGQLMYPADYIPGHRYPLVIQAIYGNAWTDPEFSLDGSWGSSGMGLGPSSFAAYPGQLLATRNIAVLQLEVLHVSWGSGQAEEFQLAVETLADQLSSSGLVDRDKVALAGFSLNGYWVEYTLEHSSFPFAAAVAADNYDASYIQSALSNWRTDDEQVNGASAFGAGLQEWLKRAPGFNAERIHTPLRIIGQSGGILMIIAEWEMFSRLRHLHKPVDLYMMPDANKYPSHTPQNPRQIMAIQEAVIDWLSYWLTGREDPNPAKRAQYARWHAFRASQVGALRAVPNPEFKIEMPHYLPAHRAAHRGAAAKRQLHG
jgi:hypothetical protein